MEEKRLTRTKLHMAARSGKVAKVKSIIEDKVKQRKKYPIDVRDKSGSTPLISACAAWGRKGIYETVELLLSEGADVNAVNRIGVSPLMWAAYGGNINIVKLLLNAGADTSLKVAKGMTKGMTAYDYVAERKGFSAIAELLQDAGTIQDKKPEGLITQGVQARLEERHQEEMERKHKERPKENSPTQHGTKIKKSPKQRGDLKPSSFRIPNQQIRYGELLGAGGFGKVYKARWNHADVAVKKLLLEHLTADSIEDFEKETAVHFKLRHPNIVLLYGVTEEQPFGMVMEYMSQGSLDKFLRKHPRDQLSWTVRFNIAIHAASGLSYLHENEILHRDLKSLNILLDEKTRAKLADFGLAKLRSETASHTQAKSGLKGTAQWTAPELFASLEPEYNEKTDVYGYGSVLWELAAHKYPYEKANQYAIPTLVMNGTRETFPADTPEEYAKLGQRCWDAEASNRPTVDEIIRLLVKMMPQSEEDEIFDQSSTDSSSYGSAYLPPSNISQGMASSPSANVQSSYLADTQVSTPSNINSFYLANSGQSTVLSLENAGQVKNSRQIIKKLQPEQGKSPKEPHSEGGKHKTHQGHEKSKNQDKSGSTSLRRSDKDQAPSGRSGRSYIEKSSPLYTRPVDSAVTKQPEEEKNNGVNGPSAGR